MPPSPSPPSAAVAALRSSQSATPPPLPGDAFAGAHGPPFTAAKMHVHKSRLQEYAQKSAIPRPVYQTFNEGSQHSPQFRSFVTIDGQKFMSSSTFLHIKEAEQDAARVALEVLELKIKQQGCRMLHEDATFSKSILNELAAKISVPFPTYEVTSTGGNYQMFISTVTFNGEKYSSARARSKKEAEQMAARAAIESLSGTSHGNTIFQIMISKRKIFAALYGSDEIKPSQNNFIGGPSTEAVPCTPSSLVPVTEGTVVEGDTSPESKPNILALPCFLQNPSSITSDASVGNKRSNPKNEKGGEQSKKKLRTVGELVSAST